MRLGVRSALLAPLLLWGLSCRSADVGTGSNTNWVGCETDQDCVERGSGQTCVQGSCKADPVEVTDGGSKSTLQPGADGASVDVTADASRVDTAAASRVEAGLGEPHTDATLVEGTSMPEDTAPSPDTAAAAPPVTTDADVPDAAAALETPVSAEGELDWTVEVDTTVATLPWDLAAGLEGDVYLLAHGIGPIVGADTQGRVAPKVIKYDANGTQLWEQSAAPGAEGGAYSGGLAVSAAGEVYATAVVGPWPDVHGILTKYAVDGRFIFSEELGAQGSEVVSATALDSDDSVYIVGEAVQDTNAAFMEKRGSDGALIWSQISEARDSATDVAVDGLGNVYVTGLVLGVYDEALEQSPQDLFLRKYTSDGELLWDRGSGLEGQIAGWSVAVDAEGNAYVAGVSEAPADKLFGAPETVLVRFDAEGNLLWNRSWPGTHSEFPTGIAVEPSGNVYVSSHAIAPDGVAYALLGKYSAEGEQLWAKDWGPDAAYESADVVVNSEGYVFVTGTWLIAAQESAPERRGSYLKRFR